MNGPMMDTAVRPVRTGNCARGCDCTCQSECETRCCELECLVRPNFFCGQMLTDADLTAMVEWTRKRLALARYRDGWGVVCGLDVSCGPPSGGGSSCCDDAGPAVYLNPGYAIDCCGNDLVVCEPLRVDLSSMCRPAEDPCDPQPKPSTPKDPQDAGAKEGPTDCFEFAKGDLFAVQLNLRYDEDLTQGQRAMFRSGCSDVGLCEYTRVLERPCVHLEIVAIDNTYDEKIEEKWLDAFRNRLKEELERIRTLLGQGPDAVVRHLRRHPPYQLCFIEEIVCCLREQQAADKSWAAGKLGVGTYLLLDWMLRELECPCPSCRPDTGVPLSRVLLRRTEVRGRTVCKVLLIDSRIPYRRPLHKDPCRPIPEGKFDLAPLLWQSPEFARSRLYPLGVTLSERKEDLGDVKAAQKFGALVQNQKLAIDPASERELIAHVIADPFGTERIAAFGIETPYKAQAAEIS